MTTTSTVRLFQQLRAHVLTFENPGGVSVGDSLGTVAAGRFWYAGGPDNATYPYAIGRLINQQVTQGGTRIRADFEIMLFNRPRAAQAKTEDLADLMVASLSGYRDATSGLVLAREPRRDTLEPAASPGDAAVVVVRVVAEIVAYPVYLTQYAVPGS